MRPILCPPILLCLLAIGWPASGDDTHPFPPDPAMAPPVPFTSPAPKSSSAGQGVIINEGIAPPMVPWHTTDRVAPPLPSEFVSPPIGEPLSIRLRRRSNHETINQFQSSSYWTPPQPFNPYGAPNYSDALARDGGAHTRYPYFKYRAPWTYQGPAGISHTIEWSGWPRW